MRNFMKFMIFNHLNHLRKTSSHPVFSLLEVSVPECFWQRSGHRLQQGDIITPCPAVSPSAPFFPTCQVRVVRFYQSCSSASYPPPAPPATPAPPPPPSPPPPLLPPLLPLPALPTLRQALRQRPSSACTAGPQPGTFPAQCAPMPDRMPENMPDRMPEDMSDRMPENLPIRKYINIMLGITRNKIILWEFKILIF